MLSVEHRAATAPDTVKLALVGSEADMHLAILTDTLHGAHDHPPASADLDSAILDPLDLTDHRRLPRAALRTALRVRNERLGQPLTRLAASGHIAQHGDAWVHIPVLIPAHLLHAPERERRSHAARLKHP